MPNPTPEAMMRLPIRLPVRIYPGDSYQIVDTNGKLVSGPAIVTALNATDQYDKLVSALKKIAELKAGGPHISAARSIARAVLTDAKETK